MGDIAEMMLDGTLCQECGVYLGGATGFPRQCRSCRACEPAAQRMRPPMRQKVACATCGRKVTSIGLVQHMRDAHASKESTNA